MATKKPMTREDWLYKMASILSKTFKQAGYDLDKVKFRLGCGLPHGGRAFGNRRTVGQCWSHSVSADKTHEIFVSPTIADSLEVAHTLAHELVHAVVGVEQGHGKIFRKCAKAIGLTGKMTSTVPTEDFAKFLEAKIKKLGLYPHAIIDVTKRKKQGTRMIKLECGSCGYVVRTTAKWLEQGVPTCACGDCFQIISKGE